MTLITRQEKGSKLTIQEMDGNLEYLQSLARPYKVYTALLSQSDTNNPTADVLENTLGFNLNWLRNGNGLYSANHFQSLPRNKTFCFHGDYYDMSLDDNILFFTDDDGDVTEGFIVYRSVEGVFADQFQYLPIEIRVYN